MAGGKKSRGRTQAPVKARKAKSGNPAKRAEQERASLEKATASRGSAFGPGALGQDASPEDLQLPPGFEKFLGR